MRFLQVEFPERKGEFQEAEQRIRDAVRPESGTLIHVAQGIDRLCRTCPHCRGDRCEHPQGNEEAVRKWDALILKGLGISYGDAMTSRQWGVLIGEKAPLEFCLTRCPSGSRCAVSRKETPGGHEGPGS
ncbi:MAG: DUF1284 domain-containing protein [Syntrophorhabdales bacterium]|jgi:hypothetical protein